jgi:hypothetical protein
MLDRTPADLLVVPWLGISLSDMEEPGEPNVSQAVEGFVDFVYDGDGVGGETLLRRPFQNLARRTVAEIPYCAAVGVTFWTGERLRNPEPSALAFH